MNLAFADLMFLIFCVPFTAISYAKPWPFPDTICYMTIYLQYVTAYASVWTLVILAFDRFLVKIISFQIKMFLFLFIILELFEVIN